MKIINRKVQVRFESVSQDRTGGTPHGATVRVLSAAHDGKQYEFAEVTGAAAASLGIGASSPRTSGHSQILVWMPVIFWGFSNESYLCPCGARFSVGTIIHAACEHRGVCLEYSRTGTGDGLRYSGL